MKKVSREFLSHEPFLLPSNHQKYYNFFLCSDQKAIPQRQLKLLETSLKTWLLIAKSLSIEFYLLSLWWKNKLNNKIILKISQSWLNILSSLIFLRNKTYFEQYNFFDTFLLQKLKNKIPSHIFPMETKRLVFHEVELAVYGSENA